jgi:hypothetical protein
MARATFRQVKAEDLEAGMLLIDPEGATTKVYNIRRIDHERGRLTTASGVAIVKLDTLFPVKQ